MENELLSLKTTIRTKDLKSSKDFYTRILKLEVVEEFDDGTSRGSMVKLSSEPTNAFIELSEIDEEDEYFQKDFAEDSATDKVDLQIRTEDVDFWAKRLQENNWAARGPVLRPWGHRYLYLRDPDNLQIIIYEE